MEIRHTFSIRTHVGSVERLDVIQKMEIVRSYMTLSKSIDQFRIGVIGKSRTEKLRTVAMTELSAFGGFCKSVLGSPRCFKLSFEFISRNLFGFCARQNRFCVI